MPMPQPSVNNPHPASTYTVKPGDTLWSISVSVYGNGAYTNRIISANPGIDPNRLKAGATLNLPNKSTVVTEAGNTVPVVTNVNPETQYRVVSGDNLNTISRNLYGSTTMAAKIFEANKDILANPNNLKPGMVLKLPTPPTSAPRVVPSAPSSPAISAIER
jgi:nucleoid-associated protein YgaU